MSARAAVATVAAFDFDHTLSSRDNVVPFLRAVSGSAALGRALAALSPWVVASALDARYRNRVKAGLVRRLLAGKPAVAVDELARRFADDIEVDHLNLEVVARAAWHREHGHDLVIVSASFAAYLAPLSERLGFDAVLATELEVGADGLLTGALSGPNVRGAEKVRRLDEWLDGRTVELYAYGDSAGDRELFARADHATRVDRRGHLVGPAPSP